MKKENLNNCWLGHCSFRGYNEYIEKLIAQEALDAKPNKISPEISEISVFFKEFYHDNEICELIRRHPYVKASGFLEDYSSGTVFVFYSESGHGDIDGYEDVGMFDHHADGGNGRWACNHVVTADLKTRFVYISTGGYVYVDYRFPFLKEWNRFNFAIEENGKPVICREKIDFVYHNGEYVDASTLVDNDFEIEDGLLKKYLGYEETVVVPQEVERIGGFAFSAAKRMSKIELPESCKELMDYAFYGCNTLKEIRLPDTLEKIGHATFDLTGLQSLHIPAGVREINCALGNIDEVTISEKNENFFFEEDVLYSRDKTIAYYCRKMKNGIYNMPSTVTEIKPHLFESCSGITELAISENVKRIPGWAFSHCSNLRKVCFSSDLRVIESCAFDACDNLEEIHIPASVGAIEADSFGRGEFPLFIDGSATKISVNAMHGTQIIVAPKMSISKIHSDLKTRAVKGLAYALANNIHVEESIVDEYVKYLKHQKKNYLSVSWYDAHLFRFMCQHKILVAEDLIGYETIQDICPEIIPIIREMIGNHSGSNQKKNPSSVAELKKIWGYRTLDDGTLSITDYKGMDVDVIIPDAIGKKEVTAIDAYAFSPWGNYPKKVVQQRSVRSNLTSVFVPDGVVNIHSFAFWGCGKLTIRGSSNSFVKTYARKKKIPFKKK